MNSNVIWTPGVTLETMIQQAVEHAMHFYKGNKTAASRSLGISIRTLDSKIEKYEKEKEESEQRHNAEQKRRADFLERQRGIPAGAGFDSAATPSIHDEAVKLKRAAASVQTGPRVQPKPASNVAAK